MSNPFKQGDHICALYETEEEQITIASDYLADGLRRGERCLYVAESRAALERFHAALTRLGIDVPAMLRRGALIEATHADAHLLDGRFDSERMMGFLNASVEAALKDGFSGLRTCGDMSWLLADAPGSDQVLEYEAFLNQFFLGVPAAGMCQYDRRRLPARLVNHALATHTSLIPRARQDLHPSYRAQ
jgi:DcmR-like sensory protein